MPNLTVYVPDAEIGLWNAARRVAKRHNTSLHRVLADALRQDLRRAEAEGPIEPADPFADIAADAA